MNKVSKFSKTNLLYNFNIAGRTSGMSYTELHFIENRNTKTIYVISTLKL